MVPQIVAGDLRHKDTVIFWLAIALIVVSVAFISTILSLTIKCILRRQGRYQKVEKQAKSPKSNKKIWGIKRERTLEDRIEEEELQREYMIRKSYASRASLRSSSQLSHYSNDLDLEAGEGSAAGVKTEGKEGEARLHGDQRRSPEIHPGVFHPGVGADLGVHGLPMQELPRPASRHTRHSSRSSSRAATPRVLSTESSAQVPRAMIRFTSA